MATNYLFYILQQVTLNYIVYEFWHTKTVAKKFIERVFEKGLRPLKGTAFNTEQKESVFAFAQQINTSFASCSITSEHADR